MSLFRSNFREQLPLSVRNFVQLGFALALCTLLAACGGGGGNPPPLEPPPVFVQSRIGVAELGGACVETSRDCLFTGGVFIDDDAEVTVFWHERPPSGQPGWHVATHQSGDTSIRNATYVSANMDSQLRPLPLGTKRFAAVQQDTPNWTSALVDLSMPSTPYVSPRVSTPMTSQSSALISSLDGLFVIRGNVPNGSFSLGGSATARSVNVKFPPGYVNPWWDAFAPATGVTPSFWWAFNSAQTDSRLEQRLHLARVDASDGSVLDVQRVTKDAWRQSSIPDCSTFGGAPVLIREYGRGQVAVGWRNVNTPWTGCDVVVDGEVLNDGTTHVITGPAMAGSAAGLVAVWLERDLADNPAPQQYIVWRHRNASTAQWTTPVRLSNQPFTWLHSSATGPSGTLTIAWRGCASTFVDSCTEYVSKYVNGQWSTEQYLALGKGVAGPEVAINSKGQAVVTWATIYDATCSADPAKMCPRVFAYRF